MRAWALLAVLAAAPARAFSPEQMDALVGHGPSAEFHAEVFFHSFKTDRDPAVKVPAWLDAALPAMTEPIVWPPHGYHGTLSEAELWQQPPSFLYEWFELVRTTFPPSRGGRGEAPSARILEYYSLCDTMDSFVNLLYQAKRQGSLGGRGRPIMALFKRAIPEMKAATSAAARKDDAAFTTRVMAVADLMKRAYDVLEGPPPSK